MCMIMNTTRTNLAPQGSSRREQITVRPFPESGLARHGVALLEEEWPGMTEAGSSTEMTAAFEARTQELLDRDFPIKMVSVGPEDLPYFTEELRSLRRALSGIRIWCILALSLSSTITCTWPPSD